MTQLKTEMFDSLTMVYEFMYPCDEFNVGQTKRTLSINADEHNAVHNQFVRTNIGASVFVNYIFVLTN